MGLGRGNNFRAYRDVHRGETAWVLGSGRTLEYVDARFFDDKLVVAVNFAGLVKGVRRYYTVSNHHDDAQAIAERCGGQPVITTEVEQVPPGDSTGVPATEPNIVKVPSIDQPFSEFTTARHWPDDPNLFAVGPTSLHLAMRWAWYIGARHIVIAGADCGTLDGAGRMEDYPPGHLHFGMWEGMLRDIADRLRKDGVSVHSLNPFVSLALEGHTFSQEHRG